MKKIILEDYNPQWGTQFLELKAIYEHHLASHILSVEHVGSTAIAGIKAKPIIDIDIVIDSRGQLPVIIKGLEKLGYSHQGDLGIRGREAFKQISDETPLTNPKRDWPKHHLYVCQKGIESLQNHLLFRDFLQKHPEEARRYSALKERLIKTNDDDIDLYVEGKTNFIIGILEKAGFSQPLLLDIREQNRKKDDPAC